MHEFLRISHGINFAYSKSIITVESNVHTLKATRVVLLRYSEICWRVFGESLHIITAHNFFLNFMCITRHIAVFPLTLLEIKLEIIIILTVGINFLYHHMVGCDAYQEYLNPN